MGNQRKFLRWMLASFAALCFLCAMTYWGAAELTAHYSEVRLNTLDQNWKSTYSRFESRIKSDIDALLNNPIFVDYARLNNAEPYLRKFLTWKGDTSGSSPEGVEFENEKRVAQFLAHHSLANFSKQTWDSILADPELSTLQLKWLDDLISYDHLNLATHPSHVEGIKRAKNTTGIGKVGIASTLPLPDYNGLQAMALLRFAQLAQTEKTEEGAKLYRHVSYLTWTSNQLVASLVSMSMLEREQKLAAFVEPYPIELVDQARIDAMKSMSWLWAGIYREQFIADHFRDFRSAFTPETGACASAGESLTTTSGFSGLFESNAWLEQDFSENFKRSRALDRKVIQMCNLEAYAPFYITDSELKAATLQNGYGSRMYSPAFRWLPEPDQVPIARRFWGTTLISVGMPNGFSMYEKTEREPASK